MTGRAGLATKGNQGKRNDYQDRKDDGSQSTFLRLDSAEREDTSFPDITLSRPRLAVPGPPGVHPRTSQDPV